MSLLKLRNYQSRGVEFLRRNKRCLLADEVGSGKTAQSIVAASSIGGKVLVLCPKSVVLNWQAEIGMWDTGCRCNWTVLNYDKLLTKDFPFRLYDIVILDESHRAIKNPKAKRCKKIVEKLIPNASYVWFLTATPATRSAEDYYVLLSSIYTDDRWGTFNQFREKFCNSRDNPWGYGKIYSGFKNSYLLKEAFKSVALKRKKAEVAKELPSVQYTKLLVEPDASLISESLNIPEAVIRELIANGKSLPSHIASHVKAIGLSNVESAVDWIGNFPEDESLVIFAWHREVIDLLVKGIDTGCAVITGDTPSNVRQSYIDSFQKGDIKRSVCNIASGGVGINLHRASNALYVEYPWSPADKTQADGRIHRLGSTADRINIYHLVAKGTIQEHILEILREKQKGIDEVGV